MFLSGITMATAAEETGWHGSAGQGLTPTCDSSPSTISMKRRANSIRDSFSLPGNMSCPWCALHSPWLRWGKCWGISATHQSSASSDKHRSACASQLTELGSSSGQLATQGWGRTIPTAAPLMSASTHTHLKPSVITTFHPGMVSRNHLAHSPSSYLLGCNPPQPSVYPKFQRPSLVSEVCMLHLYMETDCT